MTNSLPFHCIVYDIEGKVTSLSLNHDAYGRLLSLRAPLVKCAQAQFPLEHVELCHINYEEEIIAMGLGKLKINFTRAKL